MAVNEPKFCSSKNFIASKKTTLPADCSYFSNNSLILEVDCSGVANFCETALRITLLIFFCRLVNVTRFQPFLTQSTQLLLFSRRKTLTSLCFLLVCLLVGSKGPATGSRGRGLKWWLNSIFQVCFATSGEIVYLKAFLCKA